MQTNIYLFFDGDCEAAFKFYEACFGAKIETMMTNQGSPVEAETPPQWRTKILHACLRTGSTTIMASDAPPGRSPGKPQGFYVSLGVDTPAEAERIFRELSANGTVATAMDKTFFAERFGMCTDRFGIPWMVVCEKA